jgi:hypothetical protein
LDVESADWKAAALVCERETVKGLRKVAWKGVSKEIGKAESLEGSLAEMMALMRGHRSVDGRATKSAVRRAARSAF